MSVLTTSQTGNGCRLASPGEPPHGQRNHVSDLAQPAWNSPHLDRLFTSISLLPGLLTLACAATLWADDWQTGEHFTRALQSPISVTMENNPIRDGLRRLGNSQAVSIFVDRRVDPTAELRFSAQQEPLDDVIRGMARQRGLGVGYVGAVVYVGPPLTAARISTLAVLKNQQAGELSPRLKRKMLVSKPLIWPRLSEPRWILRKLSAEAGLKLPAADTIPHDLWLEGDYPPLTLPERLTLVLAGFGLTYRVDEKKEQLLLKAMPKAVALERVYKTRVDVNRIIPALRKDYPGAFIRGTANELRVRGTIEDQRAIEAYLNPSNRRKKTTDGQHVYTLNVKDQPLGKLIERMASQLDLTVEYGAGAQLLTDQRVSFRVTEVTIEELFQAAVGPANLSAVVDETAKTVTIE